MDRLSMDRFLDQLYLDWEPRRTNLRGGPNRPRVPAPLGQPVQEGQGGLGLWGNRGPPQICSLTNLKVVDKRWNTETVDRQIKCKKYCKGKQENASLKLERSCHLHLGWSSWYWTKLPCLLVRPDKLPATKIGIWTTQNGVLLLSTKIPIYLVVAEDPETAPWRETLLHEKFRRVSLPIYSKSGIF